MRSNKSLGAVIGFGGACRIVNQLKDSVVGKDFDISLNAFSDNISDLQSLDLESKCYAPQQGGMGTHNRYYSPEEKQYLNYNIREMFIHEWMAIFILSIENFKYERNLHEYLYYMNQIVWEQEVIIKYLIVCVHDDNEDTYHFLEKIKESYDGVTIVKHRSNSSNQFNIEQLRQEAEQRTVDVARGIIQACVIHSKLCFDVNDVRSFFKERGSKEVDFFGCHGDINDILQGCKTYEKEILPNKYILMIIKINKLKIVETNTDELLSVLNWIAEKIQSINGIEFKHTIITDDIPENEFHIYFYSKSIMTCQYTL